MHVGAASCSPRRSRPTLALGGHLKAAVAFGDGRSADIGMPGHDGYRLLRELRSRGIRALRAGFVHHVSKPIDPALIIDVVGALRDVSTES